MNAEQEKVLRENIKQLIEVDVTFRIEWNDFFNHRWFEN